MIDLAQTVAAFLSPLAVPLMIANLYGTWRLDRRLVAVETIVKGKV